MNPRKAVPTAPTVVLYVRHGSTPTTGKVLPGRAPGLHLSDKGRSEAQATAERIAISLPPGGSTPIQAVYSSPMERARETAAPLAKRLGLRVRIDRSLIECDFGSWTGRKLTSLSTLAMWRQVHSNPSGFRFPDGESFAEMYARVLGASQRMREAHPGGVVVAVSHADPIKVALTDALGAHLESMHRLTVSTASVSVVSYSDSGATVLAINSSGDLPGTLVRP